MKGLEAFSLIILFLLSTIGLNAQTVKFVTGEWAPFTSKDISGQGFVTEIVLAAAQEAGIRVELFFAPWARCELMVKSGEAFASFPYVKTEKRQKSFNFSDTITISYAKVFYYAGFAKEISWSTLADFLPYRMGAVRGSSDVETLVNAGIKPIIATDSNAAFGMLKLGRMDYYPENELVARMSIKNLFPGDVDKFLTLTRPYSSNSLMLLVSRTYPKSQELLLKFNSGLATIRKTGVFQAIQKKYGL